MLFCTFVLPLLLSIPLDTRVLVNSLFCFTLFIICHSSVKCPTFFTSVLFRSFVSDPDTWEGSGSPHNRNRQRISLWKERIIPKKEQNSAPETENHSSVGGYFRKMRPLGLGYDTDSTFREASLPSSTSQVSQVSLYSSSSYQLCAKQLQSCPPFASPPNLLPFPSSRLTFAGTKHSQPQRSVSPRHSWSTGLAVSTPCNACRSSLFLEGDSCSQDSFLGKCVLLHVEIILDKFRPKWAACIKRVSTPNSGAKIHLPGDDVKGGL